MTGAALISVVLPFCNSKRTLAEFILNMTLSLCHDGTPRM